ncbi:hypothetical protein J2R89_007096 [Bradyrhizobium elkanii]|nr:hypothetical protein [Bradyrhizobium elkanii]
MRLIGLLVMRYRLRLARHMILLSRRLATIGSGMLC